MLCAHQLTWRAIHSVEAEQQNCDWYVEKKLRDERIAELTREIGERDALEDKMEVRRRAEVLDSATTLISCLLALSQTCVHSLFERLKQLEVTNHKLRAKLSAVTGRSGSSFSLRTPTPSVRLGTAGSARTNATAGGADVGGSRDRHTGGGGGGGGGGGFAVRPTPVNTGYPTTGRGAGQVVQSAGSGHYPMPLSTPQHRDGAGPPALVHDSVGALPVSPESSPRPGLRGSSGRVARLRDMAGAGRK